MTCHASIVSRELGIPCIVGTKSRGEAATEVLKGGEEITVDASNGVVFAGNLQVKKAEAAAAPASCCCCGNLPCNGNQDLHEFG